MAELKCGVTNCTYNNDRCCCKGDILVGGSNAHVEDDTCCESFRENSTGTASNSMNPCRTIRIDCEAVKCVYNDDRTCVAEHVDIKGCGACDCGETACATFKER